MPPNFPKLVSVNGEAPANAGEPEVKRDVNPNVVALLRQKLAEAEAGAITCVAVVEDDCWSMVGHGASYGMLGSLEALKHHLLHDPCFTPEDLDLETD